MTLPHSAASTGLPAASFSAPRRRGAFDPATSDLDFLVELRHAAEMTLAEQPFGLWSDLQPLFRRKVDLLTPGSPRNPDLI